MDRLYGIGKLDAGVALQHGVTGPMLRAPGVNWDLRKVRPYMGYEQYDFNVPFTRKAIPTPVTLSVWRRCQIVEDRRTGVEQTAAGTRALGQPQIHAAAALGAGHEQSLIHHFKLWTEGFPAPDGSIYQAVGRRRGSWVSCSQAMAVPSRVAVTGARPRSTICRCCQRSSRSVADWLPSCFCRAYCLVAGSLSCRHCARRILTDESGNKISNEVKQILSKYPPEQKRSAVMPLLYLAQREEGYLSKAAMQDVAQIVGITETDIAARWSGFTLFTTTKKKANIACRSARTCRVHCGADEFMKLLCDNLGIKVGETTADGFITLEAVTCLPPAIKRRCSRRRDRTASSITRI